MADMDTKWLRAAVVLADELELLSGGTEASYLTIHANETCKCTGRISRASLVHPR
jgi:hypothetical protein